MESPRKVADSNGKVVHHGLTTYGAMNSTKQHTYVQHLGEYSPNSFAVFLKVLHGLDTEPEMGEESDYLHNGPQFICMENRPAS
jgi:glucose-6-phosphate isomerase